MQDKKKNAIIAAKARSTPQPKTTQVRSTPDQTDKVKLCRLLMPKTDQKQ